MLLQVSPDCDAVGHFTAKQKWCNLQIWKAKMQDETKVQYVHLRCNATLYQDPLCSVAHLTSVNNPPPLQKCVGQLTQMLNE